MPFFAVSWITFLAVSKSYPFFILRRILLDPDSMPNHKPIQPACRIFPRSLLFISGRILALHVHSIPSFSSINKSQSFSSDLMLQLIELSLNRMMEVPYFSLIFLISDTMFSGDRIRYCLLYTSPSPRDGLLSR